MENNQLKNFVKIVSTHVFVFGHHSPNIHHNLILKIHFVKFKKSKRREQTDSDSQ